jgi:hypothetical protein
LEVVGNAVHRIHHHHSNDKDQTQSEDPENASIKKKTAMILRMRPKKKPKTEAGFKAEKKVERETKFPGLAIPDSKVKP